MPCVWRVSELGALSVQIVPLSRRLAELRGPTQPRHAQPVNSPKSATSTTRYRRGPCRGCRSPRRSSCSPLDVDLARRARVDRTLAVARVFMQPLRDSAKPIEFVHAVFLSSRVSRKIALARDSRGPPGLTGEAQRDRRTKRRRQCRFQPPYRVVQWAVFVGFQPGNRHAVNTDPLRQLRLVQARVLPCGPQCHLRHVLLVAPCFGSCLQESVTCVRFFSHAASRY